MIVKEAEPVHELMVFRNLFLESVYAVLLRRSKMMIVTVSFVTCHTTYIDTIPKGALIICKLGSCCAAHATGTCKPPPLAWPCQTPRRETRLRDSDTTNPYPVNLLQFPTGISAEV